MPETKKDYYTILGVPRTATQDEIRAKYWSLAREYHPDTQTDAATKKLAEAEMAKITEAYDVLSDPEKRAELDKKPSTGTTVAKRVVGGLSTLHGIMTGPAMGKYVNTVEKTVPWDLGRLKSDVGNIVKNVQPGVTFPSQQTNPKKEKTNKPKKAKKEESAIDTLKKRYARGEITEQQYLNMKKELV